MPRRPRLLQFCNVGQICGGTAACAWTVARSLPAWEHHVAFPGPVTPETRDAFRAACLWEQQPINRDLVAAVQPDIVLLHNQPAERLLERLPAPTIQYLHSILQPANADLTLCCSHWLAERLKLPRESVLWQAVPRPAPLIESAAASRGQAGRLIVGRLCTPAAAKWPRELIAWYAELATACPHVAWEFVGCPEELQRPLADACRQNVVFHPANWSARGRLRDWDVLLYHHPQLAESFGRTVAEAMRAGCIPVVDRQGGFVEQVTEGCGRLCTGTAEFIAALQALKDRAVRGRMSRQAQERAEREFSLERFSRELLARFDQAAARFRAGSVATPAAGTSTASPRAARSA
ncbi:glycosyltransferase family 4 protein [Planctellipticum variicoloris]|uniref:glycosyltransferase family 4 protein n=1 Tax=Planctellipticum variicoloris TaxID=3064265 RepID=UPI003013F87B|nr:glycosyltransferase family 4 protein [Planctomycetaceae bacterium SH412]